MREHNTPTREPHILNRPLPASRCDRCQELSVGAGGKLRRSAQALAMAAALVACPPHSAFAGETASAAAGQTPAAPRAPVQSIEGGVDATADDYPSIAMLLNHETRASDWWRHICGGTLIHPEWVLTAAHCFLGSNGHQYLSEHELLVGLGVSELSTRRSSTPRATTKPGGGAQFYVASKIHIHPSYFQDESRFDNDIALVRLAVPASTGTAGAAPQTAYLQQTRMGGGVRAHVVGWGGVVDRERPDRLLRPTRLKASSQLVTVGSSDCQQRWDDAGGNHTITARTLCAQDPAREVDSCGGDSGDPLYRITDRGEQVVIGTVSFGPRCESEFFASVPALHARVSALMGWITQTTGLTFPVPPSEAPEPPPVDSDNRGNPPPDEDTDPSNPPPSDNPSEPPPSDDSGLNEPPQVDSGPDDPPQVGGGDPAASPDATVEGSGDSRSGQSGSGGGCAARGGDADPLLWLLILAALLAPAGRLRPGRAAAGRRR